MAETVIPRGHPLAVKIFSAGIWAQLLRRVSFLDMLTGPTSGIAKARRDLERMETSHQAAIVMITDLSKGGGETVSVDLVHPTTGLPAVGDEYIEGYLSNLTFTSMDMRINQIRKGVEDGGAMSQQRTVHNLRQLAYSGLRGWFMRWKEQIQLVHLAGARGSHMDESWILPTEDHEKFGAYVVNELQPPSFGDHFYAGDAKSIEELTTTSILTLTDIDMLAAKLCERHVPMQGLQMKGERGHSDDMEPFHVLMITPRQRHYLQTHKDPNGYDLSAFLAGARERSASNPLFKPGDLYWNGILVKTYKLPICFFPGETVKVTSTEGGNVVNKTVPAFAPNVGARVDRAILIGGQALAMAYGRLKQNGREVYWHEEDTDHKARDEISVSIMSGCKKMRFKTKAGRVFDHGVQVIDSYAPDPQLKKVI